MIMHDGPKKYAIRGETRIKSRTDGREHIEGGKTRVDASFKGAPAELKRHALDIWKHYQKVKEIVFE